MTSARRSFNVLMVSSSRRKRKAAPVSVSPIL
nr:MAG TPA: hypothetical protein [Caudoviricetes sp.]